ncbi:MAG: DUF4445 domain-containing protein [Armatimonadetes bacterium]|nr:DUF4445 domain-containing protein [Armatimonadota bacterium]
MSSSENISIVFQPGGKSVSVGRGSALRQAIEEHDIGLAFPCGGKGRCGKCKVLFEEGAPPATPNEDAKLTEAEIAAGYRLGCDALLPEDAVVRVDETRGLLDAHVLASGAKREIRIAPRITKRHAIVPAPSTSDLRSDLTRIVDELGSGPERVKMPLPQLRSLGRRVRRSGFSVTGVFSLGDLIGIEEGDTTDYCFGAAFDIGTTTIAGYLMDLSSGRQLSVASGMNPQTRIGDDVISRINYTMQEPKGLARMRRDVVGEINRLLDVLLRASGVKRSSVYDVAIVGNTCMSHLFLGIDPRHLAASPYVPAVSSSLCLVAGDSGIRISRSGTVRVLPSIAGFVGADTVGMILSSRLRESDVPMLAVDIGTNGEIVLGLGGRMLACSTAAGPALEGAHIRHGMRAAPGAVDTVCMESGEISFSTVGCVSPIGICGSGLLDAVVCMCQAGIVESNGRIVDSTELPKGHHLRDRVVQGERGSDFLLVRAEESANGKPIVVTQRDVREVQLAKGAIATGIRTLMECGGVGPEDLGSVVLAGAFGNYMRKESAVALGLIPDVPLGLVHSIGNAAGEGAKLALLSTEIFAEADEIAESVEYIELTIHPGFQDRFSEELMFGCSADA